MQTKAFRIHEFGGPEKMQWETVPLPPLGHKDVLVRVVTAGLNFIDVYHRTGLYPLPLPTTLGMEGAGIVEATGGGVSNFQAGDSVGYCVAGPGSYAKYRVMDADRLIPLPSDVSYEQAAAMLLKGMTVEYLVRRTYTVQPGDVVLFYAAAGGVGLIACQWLKRLGATVIGVVGSLEKAELAKEYGSDYVILYNDEDVSEKVREITDGRGVPVVYDAVGRATFKSSLDSLAPRGTFVSFGNASGPVEPFAPALLSEKGSLFFTRPTLMTYCASSEDMLASAEALFKVVREGLKVEIRQRRPISEAPQAQADLEARKTTGSTVLFAD